MQGSEVLNTPDFRQALEQSPFQEGDLPGLSTAIADTFDRLSPEQRKEFTEALNELAEMPEEQLQSFLRLISYVEQNPSEYPKLIQQLVASGAFDPEDAPAEYDANLMAILKVMVTQAIQMSNQRKPEGFAKGGIVSLREAANKVRSAGRDGDTILAHINPLEAGMLKRMGGSGTINPKTGLPEFKFWNSFKKIFKIGAQIVATAALTAIGVPPIISGAIVGGVSSLLSGGNAKDALKSALIGGVTSGLGSGFSSVASGGGFLEGAFSGTGLFGGGSGGGSSIFSNLFGGGSGAGAAGEAAGAAAADLPAAGAAQTIGNLPAGQTVPGGVSLQPTVSATPAAPPSGIASLTSAEGLKNIWSNYKLPIILGGGAALIGLSNSSKEKVAPSLVTGPTGTTLLAQQPGVYGFNVGNFQQRASEAQPPVFPGGGYIAPTTTAPRAPVYDFANIQYPRPFFEQSMTIPNIARRPPPDQTMMAKAGGHISGPGTGTSDSIPARLSDGEFVMTADAVRGAGNGSRMKGARKMYELMHKFERMA
jgi:hypothetical protein